MARPSKSRKPSRPRPRKPRQQVFKEMASPEHKDLIVAAQNYVEARDEWQGLHKPMIDAKAVLMNRMDDHKLESYIYDGLEIKIDQKRNVHVRVVKEEAEEDAEAGEAAEE